MDKRLPSEKQTSYARAIASALRVSLPSERSRNAYRTFISAHADDYRSYRENLPWETVMGSCDDGHGHWS